jgi:hypothetical protein
MSESQARGAGRYQRSSGGLIGAMIVTVLAVLAFAAFRALTSDNKPTPVRAVDYAAMLRAGRADGKLAVLAPASLPTGWRATSATYDTGSSPAWHLGLLTAKQAYVGVEESQGSAKDLVEEHVDVDARQGKDVTLAGESWQSWTDSGGDYALVRGFVGPGSVRENVLVVGSASAADVRRIAESLQD